MNAARVQSARRWEIAAYAVQLPIAVAVFATWLHVDHYRTHAATPTTQLVTGLASVALVLVIGYELVRQSAAVQHPHRLHKLGYLATLGLSGWAAWQGGDRWDVAYMVAAFLVTAGACGATAVRYGEALLPSDPRGTWEPITEREFYAAWENLTQDRAELVLQDSDDTRLTIWSLPIDITGEPYTEPLPFTAMFGAPDAPVGFSRFTLATESERAAR